MPATAPSPQDWRIQQAIVMQRADADVIRILKRSQADINAMLKRLAARPGIGAQIRRAQLLLAKREIQREMARVWRQIGDVVEARRLEAAARVLDQNRLLDEFMLGGAGLPDGPDVARAIADAELDAARSGLDRMIARTSGSSYVPLSQRVYASSVAINGPIARIVDSALSRSLSAREFAKEVAPFVNPNTPGGMRYAAMRLARTEINNAAHAVAIDAMRDKPWVESMKWHLSGSHPRTDICNAYASGGPKGDGVYQKTAVPAKPHPQCFCYVVPVAIDEDEFLDNLVKGEYDDYISKYRNIQKGEVVRSTLREAPAPVKKAPAKKAPATPKPKVKKTAPATTPAHVPAPPPPPPAPVAPRKATKPPVVTPRSRLLDASPRLSNRGLVGRSADIDFDAQNTNPKYGRLPHYDINCVHVVNSFELRARGLQVAASKLPDPLVPNRGRNAQEALNRWVLPDGSPHGRSIHQLLSASQAKDVARAWPEGARGWVRVSWKGGGGHIINVEKINGRVRLIDAQNGTLDVDFAAYTKLVKRDGWSIARVDDLEPTDSVVEFIETAVR